MHMNRERVSDGIFNYCTRRCELCSFRDNCTLYQSEREYEWSHLSGDGSDQVHDSFAETLRLLEEWCKGEGIDFEEIRREAAEQEVAHLIPEWEYKENRKYGNRKNDAPDCS